jgi:hypothetical protein
MDLKHWLSCNKNQCKSKQQQIPIPKVVILVIVSIMFVYVSPSFIYAKSGEQASLQVRMEQTIAAREVENVINKYEVLLSQGYIERACNLFALSEQDVQADVGFGLYYGKNGIEILILKLHEKLEGNADKGGVKPGAFYCVENTSGIVEVAEDLKTAKGLWFGYAFSTDGNAKEGFHASYGMARRAVDFIKVNGEWKIWHYVVYGMVYAPIGLSYTDPSIVKSNADMNLSFTGDLAAMAPPAAGVGIRGTWRPDRALTGVLPPEPYRTFSETFSYAIKKD